MTIQTGYYNSVNGDRKYNAETMSKYFSGLFTRGVIQNYKNKLIVTATSGMNIKIPTGKAFFSDGKWIENTADIILKVDPSEVTLNRIDSIVLRNDKNEGVRNATIVLKKGVPATEPTPPTLTNDEYIEEMCLAEIVINKRVESITQADIRNTIPDTSKCGYITGLIQQVDTKDLYLQYEADMKGYISSNKTLFDEWFKNVRDTVGTATLIREYKDTVITSLQDQTDIPINEKNYFFALDILNVYINGLRLIEGKEYTNEKTHIKLKKGLDKGQPVEIVIHKSIDGNKAETVISQVEALNNQMGKILKYNYYATGENDNKKITELAQNFLKGTGKFAGVSAYAEMVVNVYGTLGVSATVQGTGNLSDPFIWFILGKHGQSVNSERKITFDFTHTDRINLSSTLNLETVAIAGDDINIKGIQLVLGGDGSHLKLLNGKNSHITDSQLYLNATNLATGSEQGGFFERCAVNVTSTNKKAVALHSNGTTPLKVVDCELLCYNGTSASDESVAILGEANKTEGVIIVERCNIPLRVRDGFKQNHTIKIEGGYASLVSNMLGKAPVLYNGEKCTNVGSMIVSK